MFLIKNVFLITKKLRKYLKTKIRKEVITVFCNTQETGHLKNLETGRPDPPFLLFFIQPTFIEPLLNTNSENPNMRNS